ncbi:hypothetical protein [Kitasatospora sp. LaBMicrA B282]|uniref:hypothetical protein n=1 Tax=Kitasatospora sp. LaBMicrA B282 TaxID=3420949 RepID=UPI003D0D5532
MSNGESTSGGPVVTDGPSTARLLAMIVQGEGCEPLRIEIATAAERDVARRTIIVLKEGTRYSISVEILTGNSPLEKARCTKVLSMRGLEPQSDSVLLEALAPSSEPYTVLLYPAEKAPYGWPGSNTFKVRSSISVDGEPLADAEWSWLLRTTEEW